MESSFFYGFSDELVKVALNRAMKELIRKSPKSRKLRESQSELHRASGKLSPKSKRYKEIQKIMNKIDKKMTSKQRMAYEAGTG